MTSPLGIATIAGLLVVGGALVRPDLHEASAQSPCFTQCMSSPGWNEEKCKNFCYGEQPQAQPGTQTQPAVLGFVRRSGSRRASCGEFHYWDGTSCVDARDNAPN